MKFIIDHLECIVSISLMKNKNNITNILQNMLLNIESAPLKCSLYKTNPSYSMLTHYKAQMIPQMFISLIGCNNLLGNPYVLYKNIMTSIKECDNLSQIIIDLFDQILQSILKSIWSLLKGLGLSLPVYNHNDVRIRPPAIYNQFDTIQAYPLPYNIALLSFIQHYCQIHPTETIVYLSDNHTQLHSFLVATNKHLLVIKRTQQSSMITVNHQNMVSSFTYQVNQCIAYHAIKSIHQVNKSTISIVYQQHSLQDIDIYGIASLEYNCSYHIQTIEKKIEITCHDFDQIQKIIHNYK